MIIATILLVVPVQAGGKLSSKEVTAFQRFKDAGVAFYEEVCPDRPGYRLQGATVFFQIGSQNEGDDPAILAPGYRCHYKKQPDLKTSEVTE